MSEHDLAADPFASAGQIDPATMRAQLDTTFQVGPDTNRIPLRLVEVSDGR